MSLHPSLKTSRTSQQKSVLTRLEKMLELKKKDKWTEENYVLGLPKVKVLKYKIKKKAKQVEEGETKEAVPAASVAAAATAKPSEKKSSK